MITVKELLLPIEPNFDQVVELGPDAVSELAKIIQVHDPLLASRATYALGRLAAATMSGKIPASVIDKISAGLHEAAQSQFDLVRVAAAAATHGMPSGEAAPIQLALLDDKDAGVRRTVLEALKPDAEPAVVARIEKLVSEEPNKEMQELVLEVLKRMKE